MATTRTRRGAAGQRAAAPRAAKKSVIEIQAKSRYVDESPVFPIEKGNPVFDFTTPRTLRLVAFKQDGAVHAVPTEVNGVEYQGRVSERHPASTMTGAAFRNDVIEFNWWELDDKGVPVRDARGNLVPRLDENGRKIPQPMPALTKGQQMELQVPRDNSLIQNLLRNPRVHNVRLIDGIPTNGMNKEYVILDPHAQAENKRRELQSKQAATALIAELKDGELFFWFAYFNLHKENEHDYNLPDGSGTSFSYLLMRSKLWEFANDNHDELLSALRDDVNFHMRMLLRAAEAIETVRYTQSSGYVYRAVNNASIGLGLDEDKAIAFLKEQRNAHVYHEMSAILSYQDYLEPWIERSANPADATPAHPSVLLEGRMTIERSVKDAPKAPARRRGAPTEQTTSLTKKSK